ncbi:MAG: ABC-2 family transporter protein [Anaerolineales bacterium]|nr:ABC-2 family transporter protein [Anaerolineales bacterium]
MYHLRLIGSFAKISAQNEMAYRANFWISLLNSALNLVTGILGVWVLFEQIETLNGWDLPATLAILGVYLSVGALRGLFISPSLDTLTGMDGEVWTGKFDFTLLKPVDVQFQASFRHWHPLALIDLALGLGVLYLAVSQMGSSFTAGSLLSFAVALAIAMTLLYAILLVFAGLVFWSPGFLFTWVFDGIFQMARYPVGIYPTWLQWLLTWLVPIGIITTVPAEAFTGNLNLSMLVGSGLFALVAVICASLVFRLGVRRYASASS